MTRRYGDGTIFGPNARGEYGARLPGQKGRRLPGRWRSYDEAARALNAALWVLRRGEMVAPGGVTLCDFGERCIDHWKRAGKRSAKDDSSRWRTMVSAAPFYRHPIPSITTRAVRRWVAALLQSHRAPGGGYGAEAQRRAGRQRRARSTVQNALNLLRRVLAEAVDQSLPLSIQWSDVAIDRNPAAGVQLPRTRGKVPQQWTYLLPAEQEALLQCEAIPRWWRRWIAVLLGTGMRRGELAALRVRDVCLEGGYARVVAGGPNGRPTKGGDPRTAKLLGPAPAAIVEQLAALKRRRRRNPRGLLFPGPRGGHVHRLPRDWHRWVAAALGPSERRHDGRTVVQHSLRHTLATSLVCGWWHVPGDQPWTMAQIALQLGHSDPTLTARRYAHLVDSALDSAAIGVTRAPQLPQSGETHASGASALGVQCSGDSNGDLRAAARPYGSRSEDAGGVALVEYGAVNDYNTLVSDSSCFATSNQEPQKGQVAKLRNLPIVQPAQNRKLTPLDVNKRAELLNSGPGRDEKTTLDVNKRAELLNSGPGRVNRGHDEREKRPPGGHHAMLLRPAGGRGRDAHHSEPAPGVPSVRQGVEPEDVSAGVRALGRRQPRDGAPGDRQATCTNLATISPQAPERSGDSAPLDQADSSIISLTCEDGWTRTSDLRFRKPQVHVEDQLLTDEIGEIVARSDAALAAIDRGGPYAWRIVVEQLRAVLDACNR